MSAIDRPNAPRKIITQHAGRCTTCEEKIVVGEAAYWESGIGLWHADCPRPQNLAHYRKERDQERRLR